MGGLVGPGAHAIIVIQFMSLIGCICFFCRHRREFLCSISYSSMCSQFYIFPVMSNKDHCSFVLIMSCNSTAPKIVSLFSGPDTLPHFSMADFVHNG
jgi:hypothetical protein